MSSEPEVPRDIGVKMLPHVFRRRLREGRKADNRWAAWPFYRGIPEGVVPGSRLWVASAGRWIGYFVIDRISGPAARLRVFLGAASAVEFYSDSFVYCDGGRPSRFKGFTFNVPKVPVPTVTRG